MKTVYSTQEGVKMNSDLDFGPTQAIRNEFHYLIETIETIFDAEIKYYYRITDDGYILLAYTMFEDDLKIIAQYKLKYDALKENIFFILRNRIEANLPYIGFPKFQNTPVLTKKEFEDLTDAILNEKTAISEQAKQNITPLINFLEERQLHPRPTGDTPFSWKARCPAGTIHHIMVSSKHDEWGCGYCGRKGGLKDLEQWLDDIRYKAYQKPDSKKANTMESGPIYTKESIKDQNNISTMMKKLKSGSIQTEDTFK